MISQQTMSFNNLQTVLLILFILFAVQFFILFRVVNLRDNNQRDSKITELLNAVREQQRILKNQYENVNGIPGQLSSGTGVVDRCETVQVCTVCTGYKSSRILTTLIKSIVFYRRNRLHLHLVVDNVAHRILGHLFETWNIPALQVSFYSTTPLLPEVAWVTTTHYSGMFGLMKLSLLTVLPQNLTKVIVLDTDITFNTDITELWRTFSKFGPKQAIGLVENQSNWYLRQRTNHWPALGHGYNTGVVLLKLDRLRAMHWNDYWKKIATMYLQMFNKTQLADQDIINAAIKHATHLLYVLPCEWNVQLSLFTKSESCYNEGTEPKVVHWNSLRKEDVPNKHREFFRKLYRTFVEYDGNLLRKGVVGCTPLNLPSHFVVSLPLRRRLREEDKCEAVRLAGSLLYRTHIFFLPFDETDKNPEVDVTLVTQLSSDRLLMLELLASQWTGPISAAVFASDVEAQTLAEFVSASTMLRHRRNIGYHIVYKEVIITSQDYYPVNFLRNVAMEQVQTPFLLHVDVDFITKTRMREYIIDNIKKMNLTLDSKVALVIAPFETNLHRFGLSYLKKHVLMLWDSQHIAPFRFNMWRHGQYPINYEKWKNASEPYKIDWALYFEPYVVVSVKSPRFDPRFVGFGWNKAAYSMTLHAEGYDFIVLPEACIVHLPHSPSISNNKFRLNPKYRRCMYVLRKEFLQDLYQKYNLTSIS